MSKNYNTKLDITGITLLSKEEYREAREYIPCIEQNWWLRSAGINSNSAAFVDGEYGAVYGLGLPVYRKYGVRPALVIDNLESANLKLGDRIKVADYTWTIIPGNMALCDKIIGYAAFREDCAADDANIYDASDIKKYLEKWWKEHNSSKEIEELNEIAELKGQIIDILEDFCYKRGIQIENKEKEDSENPAIIYGSDYDWIGDDIEYRINRYDVTKIITNNDILCIITRLKNIVPLKEMVCFTETKESELVKSIKKVFENWSYNVESDPQGI